MSDNVLDIATTPAESLTLCDLQRLVRATLEARFAEPLWITAEVSELKVNRSGHCYLNLVEKGANDGAPRAEARAVIWKSAYGRLSTLFRSVAGSELGAGMCLMMRVVVTYHEVYGFSLQIVDIDPSYTVGEVERRRRETIERLKADGVWDMNREHSLARPTLRIAVVSSPTAAGYQDFMRELGRAPYRFTVTLYESLMQGEQGEQSVVDALRSIAEDEELFDAVVIIRGGGSTSDLALFDSYLIATYVAQFPLPVLTGIGHDKDVSVADMVANTPLKTPTAVAGWLTDRMARHEAWLDESLNRLQDMALATTANQHLRIERLASELTQSHNRIYERQLSKLALWSEQLGLLTDRIIAAERLRLQSAAEVVEARKPQNILRMGFAIVRLGDKVLHSAENISVGDSLAIELADGRVIAEAKSIEKQEK